MKTIKNISLLLFILISNICIAQTNELGFGWIKKGKENSITFKKCNNPVQITVITSINHFKNTNTSYPLSALAIETRDGSLSYNMKINFSTPVANVKLHIMDLDNQSGYNQANNRPTEYILNPLPFTPTVNGDFSINSGEILPLVDNANGWLEWNQSNISFISFDVKRFDDTYGILIDKLKFDCINVSQKCDCETIMVELRKIQNELKIIKSKL